MSTTTTTLAQPLSSRTAIVTGSSRGIGRAIVVHLASLGADLVINYVSNAAQAESLANELNRPGGRVRAIAVQADVSVSQDVDALFDRAEATFGRRAHVLVNCAGVLDPKYSHIANTSEADWDVTLSVNTKGAYLCCRAAARRLATGGGGRIVMITSSAIGFSRPGYGAYTASKAAVEAMVRVLAKELKGTGITANCVAPGPVATELFYEGKSEAVVAGMVEACPLGRIGEPGDVAPVVGFLVGDSGEWVNGQVVRVNGGMV
ncbi:hypothetical protein QJS04_geneDACA013012 [Acorus gramineus]|uniref:Ketoreductase domain-containing protein n=1 Tax=Acorus gramineus TaxID=55184 RepID=A0AAV9B3V9_ACOGR|nr:hypothetical protein QJS04_geneDACA013012 [Acorus gramineus]